MNAPVTTAVVQAMASHLDRSIAALAHPVGMGQGLGPEVAETAAQAMLACLTNRALIEIMAERGAEWCMACGGPVEDWTCQACGAQHTESSDGILGLSDVEAAAGRARGRAASKLGDFVETIQLACDIMRGRRKAFAGRSPSTNALYALEMVLRRHGFPDTLPLGWNKGL